MSTRGFWELPSLYHTHWDPIWARAQERGMPCNFHRIERKILYENAARVYQLELPK